MDKALFTTVQRRFKVWFMSITVTFGQAWQLAQAEDLVLHDGLSEAQAVVAVNKIMRGVQVILDRI